MRLLYTLLITLFVLSMIEIVPILAFTLNPKISIGSTRLLSLYNMIDKYKLNHVGWFSYLLFFVLLIVVVFEHFRSIPVRIILTLVLVLCIVIPGLPILSLINVILEFTVKNPPFIHDYRDIFPAAKQIEESYDNILREYKAYEKSHRKKIDCIKENNPGFRIEKKLNPNDANCWRSVYLKRGGKVDKVMKKYFSRTMEVISDTQIHNAFFSILDPDVEIPPHIGYFKGYLRYHLGVVIPDTPERAYIVCGGEKYEWKSGRGIVFDDMYSHYVKNPTRKSRVVLYLDIKRVNMSLLNENIINFGYWFIENSPLVKYYVKNQHKQVSIQDL